MRSSSSDEDESDALFPTANDPTITLNQPPATTFTSELSPPTSQDPPDQNGYEGYHDDNMDLEPPQALRDTEAQEQGHQSDFFGVGPSGSNIAQHAQADDYGRSGEEQQEPGYAWNSKKARDEYQKAMESVVDRNFNLRKKASDLSKLPVAIVVRIADTAILGEYGDPFNEHEEAGGKSP